MTDPSPVEPERAGLDATPVLSAREREALRLLAEGRSTAEIAAAMSISRNTVRTRIHRLRAKLNVPDRRQVVPRARALGLQLTDPPHDNGVGGVPAPRDHRPVPDRTDGGQVNCARQAGEQA